MLNNGSQPIIRVYKSLTCWYLRYSEHYFSCPRLNFLYHYHESVLANSENKRFLKVRLIFLITFKDLDCYYYSFIFYHLFGTV